MTSRSSRTGSRNARPDTTLLWFDTFQERIVCAWDTKVLRVSLLYLPHLQSVTWDYSGTT